MSTTTTTTGIPHQRGTQWERMHEFINMEHDNAGTILVTAALSRILGPTFFRAQNAITEALIDGTNKGAAGLADCIVPCALMEATTGLTLAMTTAIRDSFDPLRTLEENFQAACTAAGIGTVAEANAYMRRFIGEVTWEGFAAAFPNVRLGITEQEGGAA